MLVEENNKSTWGRAGKSEKGQALLRGVPVAIRLCKDSILTRYQKDQKHVSG